MPSEVARHLVSAQERRMRSQQDAKMRRLVNELAREAREVEALIG
jgi:hypothetical protein